MWKHLKKNFKKFWKYFKEIFTEFWENFDNILEKFFVNIKKILKKILKKIWGSLRMISLIIIIFFFIRNWKLTFFMPLLEIMFEETIRRNGSNFGETVEKIWSELKKTVEKSRENFKKILRHYVFFKKKNCFVIENFLEILYHF